MEPGYDGIPELWWDSMEDMLEGSSSPEGIAAGERLLEDELEFIDLKKSHLFATEEHVIFDI